MCQLCWAEAFAEQTAVDVAARRQRERAEQAEQAAAARQALAVHGVRRQVTEQMPDWAVLGLLKRVEATPVVEVASWTRVAVEPVGWLVAARKHGDRLRALRQQGQAGRFRAGWDWADSTGAVAQAVMHHAGRVEAADGRVLAWPGMNTLVAFTGLSKRAVRYGLQVLCRSGFLRRVLVGTRVAGPVAGQPLSLATVFELRIPLSAAELLEQAELQRALRTPPQAQETDPPDRGYPQVTGRGACTPPSSTDDLSDSADLEYTGDERQNPASTPTPRPDASQPKHCRTGYGQQVRQRNAALTHAALKLQAAVDALRAIPVPVVEGLLRSWWEQHQPAALNPSLEWDQQLATVLGPWPPRRVVTNPVGLLHTRLSRLTADTARPGPAEPTMGGHAQVSTTARVRAARCRMVREQHRLRAEIAEREQAAARVDRRGHYTRIAEQLGWQRRTPAWVGV